ncbi:MAG TPA: methyltransferase domain-containing protein [Candidatus Dormibacteraeota bacterium]|nr:methyltransferase domain-containing protein [Candidatus Dormibacteraeota bacterium]
MRAAERWSSALADWAIPEEILAQAPESPWDLPPWVFAAAAQRSLSASLTPTHLRVGAQLPLGGALLDVGAGGGAASLPVAATARSLVAVDQSPAMLQQLVQLAGRRVKVTTIEGHWPEVASQVAAADVVVCANVAYNISALDTFVLTLTQKARRRVVMELTENHPQASLNWLWKYFWQLERPTSPTAEDALQVIREQVGQEVHIERWAGPGPLAAGLEPEAIAWIRKRLCLGPSREEELRDLLRTHRGDAPSQMATLWWPGDASADQSDPRDPVIADPAACRTPTGHPPTRAPS